MFSSFHHNPHLTQAADGTWLLYFNGRHWPSDDFSTETCQQNTSSPSAPYEGDYWHGGGVCSSDKDCQPFNGVGNSRGNCKVSKCSCEHHFFGAHCEKFVETVNVAYSKSLDGPWTNLLPDGAPFFDDGNTSLSLSNPAAWPLPNGTMVMAYSRAPALGIAIAPSWRGPYRRLYLPTSDGGKNYSLISPNGVFNGTLESGGEDPFIWQDKRGTWRVVFHGYGGDKKKTDGQAAYSTDLLHWTWQPEPVYSSTIQYEHAPDEVLSRRERPAVVVDDSGHPLYLLNGVMPANGIYVKKTFSYIQATRAAKMGEQKV